MAAALKPNITGVCVDDQCRKSCACQLTHAVGMQLSNRDRFQHRLGRNACQHLQRLASCIFLALINQAVHIGNESMANFHLHVDTDHNNRFGEARIHGDWQNEAHKSVAIGLLQHLVCMYACRRRVGGGGSSGGEGEVVVVVCLLYTSPSPRDRQKSRMPSSA